VDLMVQRCAGLDVAKAEVVACVRTPGAGGRRRQEIRTFATFSAELAALADWLEAEGVTQVVMEATGQYWKPIWYVLEERGFALLLVPPPAIWRRGRAAALATTSPAANAAPASPPRATAGWPMC
jgi:transposase